MSRASDQEAPSVAQDTPARRFVVGWALAWALVGCLVAAGIVVASDLDPAPALRISILLAEVVGFTALVSARLVFPLFVSLPYTLGLALQVLTLMAGTAFGSAAIVTWYPLLSIRQFRFVAFIVLANSFLAIVVGLSLYTYDRMRRQIAESYRALQEKEALERELRIARDVQQRLLPTTVPRVPGLELSGVCLPAIGVGGDYFDYIALPESSVGLVVADVSGKGVAAALLMAGLQASLRSLVVAAQNPGALAAEVNRVLYRSSESSRYATLFFSTFDPATGRMLYANAGHHPPLLFRGDDLIELQVRGLPLGLFEDSRYETGTANLQRGDLLVLFTDGVSEAPDAAEQEFGTRRLVELVRPRRGLALEQLRDAVLAELRSWTSGVTDHDDVTLVLARVS